jgi:uncharacterized protein YegL
MPTKKIALAGAGLRRRRLPSLFLLAWVVASPAYTASLPAEQHVVVVLDDSGSMNERMQTPQGPMRRMDAAKQALIQVLKQLPADADVGVLALNTKIDSSHWIVPLGSRDLALWGANINRVQAKGGTPLGRSLQLAADALIELRKRDGYGTYRMLVVTDGEANDPELVDNYLPQILARGLELHVIGVDMAGNHSLANRAHSYRAAADNVTLAQALTEVLAETSADDAGAEEDFELIAALPDGLAEAALKALTSRRHEPLREPGDQGTPRVNFRYNSTSGSSNNVFEVLFGSFLCCVGTTFGIIVLVTVLSGARKGQRRKNKR